MKVLVADSSECLRADMSAVLRRLRCEVVAEAADGQAALSAFADHDPDIAVLGVDLPGLSGVETALRLTSADAHALVVTGPDLVMVLRNGLLAENQDDTVRRLLASVRLAASCRTGWLH